MKQPYDSTVLIYRHGYSYYFCSLFSSTEEIQLCKGSGETARETRKAAPSATRAPREEGTSEGKTSIHFTQTQCVKYLKDKYSTQIMKTDRFLIIIGQKNRLMLVLFTLRGAVRKKWP